MTRAIVARTIDAPVDVVFKAVSEVGNLPNTVPDIVKVEFLSDVKSGVGTRFRETRLMNGKESMTELEVTEFIDNEHVRMVADSHGTVWDSVFAVKATGGQTELVLTMDAKAHKLLPKLMNPLVKGLIKKGLEKHMDAVKAYCEGSR